jgi:citrate lyase beta subunit
MTPRIAGIALGTAIFLLSMGIRAAPSTEGVVFHARCQVVMAAKAADITPIDNVFLDIPNIEGLAVETRQGKQLATKARFVSTLIRWSL